MIFDSDDIKEKSLSDKILEYLSSLDPLDENTFTLEEHTKKSRIIFYNLLLNYSNNEWWGKKYNPINQPIIVGWTLFSYRLLKSLVNNYNAIILPLFHCTQIQLNDKKRFSYFFLSRKTAGTHLRHCFENSIQGSYIQLNQTNTAAHMGK